MTPQDMDELFAEARGRTASASSALLARVLEDAYAAQDDRAVVQPSRALHPAPRRPWAWLGGLLGGSTALAGLASAAVAGFMIGVIQPPILSEVTGALWSPDTTLETVELIPSLDGWLSEG
ncbi:hypothetical protein SAMN04488103_10660 [Gemmobacter aquatilis]|uniref:Dihydroorotate dehydrogenase n=1 Tax=Gemmobacter aquatilis TaxID=933059 RepID=A0A1H8HWF2_9RHOB|nr:hypothetical protein [Gemmobacter aquatilis]SEN60432.1 hypothetical protein SAMN04488103_10660 [Gemmobacter aquatilis]